MKSEPAEARPTPDEPPLGRGPRPFELVVGRAAPALQWRSSAGSRVRRLARPRGPTVNRSSPIPSSRRTAAFVVASLLLAGMAWTAWPSLRALVGPRSRTTSHSSPARDVSADSPYQNTRPGVAYVGDAACARCHREIAESYRGHPMGRSLAPVGAAGDEPADRQGRGGCPSSRRASSTRSSAATGGRSTRRPAATRTGAPLVGDRGRGPLRASARGRGGSPT